MLQQAKQEDDKLINAAMNAAPRKPDPEGKPRLYTHKVSHLGEQTGALYVEWDSVFVRAFAQLPDEVVGREAGA
jgi:hypothetical protein